MSLPFSLNTSKLIYKNLAWPFILFYLVLNIYSPIATKASVFLLILFLSISNYDRVEQTLACIIKAWPLMLLILWEFFSFLWSRIPSLSIGIIINDLEICCLSLLLAQYTYNKDIASSLKFASSFLIIICVLYSVLLYPKAMSSIGLKAFYGQNFFLGEAMAICTFIQLLIPNKRKLNYALGFVGFVLIILSESKTSLNLTLTILIIWLVIILVKKVYDSLSKYSQGMLSLASKLIPILLYISLILLVFFREDVVFYLMQHLDAEDFTGRGQLWLTELGRNQDDLLTGIGVGVFWGADRASEVAQTALYDQLWIHSLTAGDGGYIDMIGALGFVGLVLLFLTYINNYRLIFKNINDDVMPLAFALTTFMLRAVLDNL